MHITFTRRLSSLETGWSMAYVSDLPLPLQIGSEVALPGMSGRARVEHVLTVIDPSQEPPAFMLIRIGPSEECGSPEDLRGRAATYMAQGWKRVSSAGMKF